MSKLTLCCCFVMYLLLVSYVQYDNSRIKYRKAFVNTFIAPILYPFGIVLLLVIQGIQTIKQWFANLYQGKQSP